MGAQLHTWAIALALSTSSKGEGPTSKPARAELVWDAPVGCPTEHDVRTALEDRLGIPLIAASSRISIIARVRRERDGYGLRLWTVTPDGTQERELQDADCEALAHAATVMMSIALGPVMGTAVEPPSPARSEREADGDEPRACTAGNEQCICGPLGACQAPLVCLSRTCVQPPAPPPPVIEPADTNVAPLDPALLEQQRRSHRLLVAGYTSWVSGLVVLGVVGGPGLAMYLRDDGTPAARTTLALGATLGGIGIVSGITMMTVGYRVRNSMPILIGRRTSQPHRRLRTFTRSLPRIIMVRPPIAMGPPTPIIAYPATGL